MKRLRALAWGLGASLGLGILFYADLPTTSGQIYSTTQTASPQGFTRPAPPFDLLVALDRYAGYELDTKFGRNPSIASGPEDIWNGGDLYTGQPLPCPAEKLEVFSGDANDTAVGTGARTFSIEGLDDAYGEETEIVTLDGTTPVDTLLDFCRAYRFKVLTAGSGGENAGDITVRSTTTTANVFAVVPAGTNRSQILAWTIPANKTAFLTYGFLSIARANAGAGSANARVEVREPGGVFQVVRNYEPTTSANVPVLLGLEIPEQSDIRVRVESVSNTNTIATGSIKYYLVDN